MATRWDERGFTLIEALVAISILVIALVALLSMLSRGSLNVAVGGGQSKATAYARRQVEQLRNQILCTPFNQPVNPPPCFPTNGADAPEVGITRTWTITPSGATVAPNRLWNITVTVTASQSSQLAGAQSITIDTMRAE